MRELIKSASMPRFKRPLLIWDQFAPTVGSLKILEIIKEFESGEPSKALQ